MKPYRITIPMAVFFINISLVIFASAQAPSQNTKGAVLIDTFHWGGGDEAEARLQNFTGQLTSNENSRGYVVVYCGQTCRYGEPEAHFRGIQEGLTFLRYDRSKISVIFGGFRKEATTEFWLVHSNDCPPLSTPTLGTNQITFVKARRKIFRPYWCC
jgi:hypothetical protein